MTVVLCWRDLQSFVRQTCQSLAEHSGVGLLKLLELSAVSILQVAQLVKLLALKLFLLLALQKLKLLELIPMSQLEALSLPWHRTDQMVDISCLLWC